MKMAMTRAERTELGALIRKREKVMKAAAAERSAKLLAEFEAKCAAIYSFNEDETWRIAKEEAERAVQEARETIAARCRELGIPPEFAPDLSFGWYGRGENAVKDRQAELRRVAKAKISAMEQEACSGIERMSLQAQTELLATGLESEGAKTFLGSLTTVELLMPSINAEEIKAVVDQRHAARRNDL